MSVAVIKKTKKHWFVGVLWMDTIVPQWNMQGHWGATHSFKKINKLFVNGCVGALEISWKT